MITETERRQIAIQYIEDNNLPSREINRFLTKHFKKISPNGIEFFPALFVKDYLKNNKRMKAGSKSSLTLIDFQEYYETGKITVEDKDGKKKYWKPSISAEEAEYYELRPCYGDKQMAVVDIDGLISSGDVDFKTFVESGKIPDFLEDASFFLSRTKSLPHFIFYIEDFPDNIKIGQYINIFKNFEGDLLLNHVWERIDSKIYNYEGKLTTVKWSDLITILNPENINAKKLLPKTDKIKKTKINTECFTTNTISIETKITSSSEDEKIKNTLLTMEKIIKAIIKEENEYFSSYEEWSRMVYGFFNESFGTSHEETARNIANTLSEFYCGGNYSEASFNKLWYGSKPKIKEPVKIGSFFKWLSEIDSQHILLKEHINKRVSSGNLTADEIRQSSEYLEYRSFFEKTNFKLNNPVRYIEFDKDNKTGSSLIFRDISSFRERFRDETGAPIFKIKNGISSIAIKFCDLWLEDQYKRKHSKLVFDPSWKPNLYQNQLVPAFNAFGGFLNYDINTVKFEENESEFICLMKYLFNEEKVFEYMKCWIASIIQNPETKTKVAPILYSKTHGTGKNSFVDGIIAILGRNNCGVVESIDDITRNFNAHLCNKLFIYGDEINANAKKVADRLKQIITRPEQNLEKKNIDAVLVDDYTNWLFTTNNENCFKVEEGCRRLLMIHCCEQKQTEYSRKSYEEIRDTNKLKKLFSFFLHYKQSNDSILKYGKFKIGYDSVIETQYKSEMLFENRPAYIQMLYKDQESLIGKTFSSSLLYEETQKYAKSHFLSSNYTSQEFSKQSQRYLENFKVRGNTCNKYVFPNNKTEFEKHLYKVDEAYYRYVYQLEESFIPNFEVNI